MCGECKDSVCDILFCGLINMVWGGAVLVEGKNRANYVGREGLMSKSVRRPVNCDGMCRGAKQARKIHRKKLRLMKRRGARMGKIGPWWEKKYTCTCTVR